MHSSRTTSVQRCDSVCGWVVRCDYTLRTMYTGVCLQRRLFGYFVCFQMHIIKRLILSFITWVRNYLFLKNYVTSAEGTVSIGRKQVSFYANNYLEQIPIGSSAFNRTMVPNMQWGLYLVDNFQARAKQMLSCLCFEEEKWEELNESFLKWFYINIPFKILCLANEPAENVLDRFNKKGHSSLHAFDLDLFIHG